MADNNIKIYHSRYSKLIKLLDFLTVNILIFIYLKYFLHRTLYRFRARWNYLFISIHKN